MCSCRRGFKLKQDLLQDARIFRMRVLEKSTASLFGRRALPRLDARKKTRGGFSPRASKPPFFDVGRGPVPRQR